MKEEILHLQEVFAQNPADERVFAQLDAHYTESLDWKALLSIHEQHAPHTNGEAKGVLQGLAKRLKKIAKQVEDKKSQGEIYIALGDLYRHELDQIEEAKKAYYQSLRAWPKDTTCLERARAIYVESKDFPRVIELYEVQIKILAKMERTEELARTYTGMAIVFGEHMGEPSRAVEMLLRSRELTAPDQGNKILYEKYRKQPELVERVRALLDQAETISGDNPKEAAKLLGRAAKLEAAREGGNLEYAKTYAEHALGLNAEDSEVRGGFGDPGHRRPTSGASCPGAGGWRAGTADPGRAHLGGV